MIGGNYTQFRIAAPRTILLKSFYISWSKGGDTFPPTFAPVRKTEIQMRKGLFKRYINPEQILYIPLEGITFPVLFFTDNPPYQEVLVNISFYPDLRISRFYEGTTEQNAAAFCSNEYLNFSSNLKQV